MIGDAISEMRSRNCGLEVRATVGSTLEVGKRSRLVAEPVEMFEIDCAMRWHFIVNVRIHTFGPLPVPNGRKRMVQSTGHPQSITPLQLAPLKLSPKPTPLALKEFLKRGALALPPERALGTLPGKLLPISTDAHAAKAASLSSATAPILQNLGAQVEAPPSQPPSIPLMRAEAMVEMTDAEFDAAERRLLECTDLKAHKALLAELCTSFPAKTWALYQRLRKADISKAAAEVAPPTGLHGASAASVRRCVACVRRLVLAEDLDLLQTTFTRFGKLPELLDVLCLNYVASAAQAAVTDATSHLSPRDALETKGAAPAAAVPGAGAPRSTPGAVRLGFRQPKFKPATVVPITEGDESRLERRTTGAVEGGGGARRVACRIDWPSAIREAAAVCDALCGLSAALSAASPALTHAVLGKLERARALATSEEWLAAASAAHVAQLVRGAMASEARDGAGRTSWVPMRYGAGAAAGAPTAKAGMVLGSTAMLLSSLPLHAAGPLYGVTAALDTALCEAVARACTLYAAYLGQLADVAETASSAVTGASPVAGSKFGAPPPSRPPPAAPLPATDEVPPLSAAAAELAASESAVPIVCLSSALALKSFVDRLAAGSERGAASAAVPPLKWQHAQCAPTLGAAAAVLGALIERLRWQIVEGSALLTTAPALSLLEATAAVSSDPTGAAGSALAHRPFWHQQRPWRKGQRCSLPMQHAASTLVSLRCHLRGGLADADAAEYLYLRTLRRSAQRLLQAYWGPTSPSEAMLGVWARDLKMLLGLVAAEVDVASLAVAPDESSAATKAVRAAEEAANAAAPSSAAEDRPTDVAEERRRLAQLALWLLSLLSLHSAPLSQLVAFLGASPAAETLAREEVEWRQVGRDAIALPSAAAGAVLGSLALPDLHVRPKQYGAETLAGSFAAAATLLEAQAPLQQAACSPLPEPPVWEALLQWKSFPLRAVPHLVRLVLRRLPAMQLAAAAAAAGGASTMPRSTPAAAGAPAPAGDEVVVDGAAELLALLNAVPSAVPSGSGRKAKF